MESMALRESGSALNGWRSAAFQLTMITAAAALPAVCHLTGAPVKALLPMHWPVIAAGLFCGWRAGLLAGAASPLISYALSGMPPAAYLPLMALELSAYGAVAGFAACSLRWRPLPAVAIALLAGRAVYVASASLSVPFASAFAGLLPGLPAALAQTLLLPLAYNRFSEKSR